MSKSTHRTTPNEPHVPGEPRTFADVVDLALDTLPANATIGALYDRVSVLATGEEWEVWKEAYVIDGIRAVVRSRRGEGPIFWVGPSPDSLLDAAAGTQRPLQGGRPPRSGGLLRFTNDGHERRRA